jgi:hypothetical protein
MRSVIRSVLSAQSSQVPTEDHTISKGEHLAQVLRDMYNIPDDLIFNQYLKVVKKLNPSLNDVNLVRPDQKIVLPSIAAFQLSPRAEAIAGKKIQEQSAEAEKSPRKSVAPEKTATQLSPRAEDEREEGPRDKKGAPVFVDPPFKKIAGNVPRSRERYIETMTSLADIFQGELHRLGDISIPLMEESHITIDTNTFPILQLTSDKRIILDYGDDLPPGIVDLVQLDPGNYEVVKLDEHENMKSVLDKVIDAAGYYAVDKSGNPLLIGDTVQFEISGDWVIYGDELLRCLYPKRVKHLRLLQRYRVWMLQMVPCCSIPYSDSWDRSIKRIISSGCSGVRPKGLMLRSWLIAILSGGVFGTS